MELEMCAFLYVACSNRSIYVIQQRSLSSQMALRTDVKLLPINSAFYWERS